MMKQSTILTISLVVICFALPELAYSADISWSNRPEDRSIIYLGQIFGNVGSTLQGAGSSVIGRLFEVFNIAVLSLGGIVVSYTIILSTINTAQEGEVMGRKWSSVWIPLRAAIGMAFLIPTASGYSLIQVFMMQIVIYGVAAANSVYTVTVRGWAENGGQGGSSLEVLIKTPTGGTDVSSTMRALMRSMACAETLNFNTACQTALSNLPDSTVQALSYSQNGSATLMIGILGNSTYRNVCGGMTSGVMAAGLDGNEWGAVNAQVMRSAADKLQAVGKDIAITPNAATVASIQTEVANQTTAGADEIVAGLRNLQPVPVTANAFVDDALKNGWIFAGSHYFDTIKKNSTQAERNFPQPVAENLPSTLGQECRDAVTTAMSVAGGLVPAGTGGISPPLASGNIKLNMQKSNIGGSGGPLYDAIANAVKGATVDIMNTLTAGKDTNGNIMEPVSSLRKFGSDIMITCENIWFTIILLSFLMMIVGCIMSGMNPLCWALGAIVTILVPVLTLIIGLLWGAGAAIGIYLPMVPYLVFTFTALGWMLLVIETIAAAPIVALGLVSPAQENLGKASAAVMLITNVFLRPSLMVIGFAVACKLVEVAIGMVNFGFNATVDASTGTIGIFGCIALLCLYGGLCIGIIHECFSLVYVLPDKITRWIGGQAESSGSVKQQLEEAKGAVDKGAEIGGGLMKSSAGAMSNVAKQSMGGGGISDIAGG